MLTERFSPEFIRTAREFSRYLSVVPDARAARTAGAAAMHDITEGGVFGAFWEMLPPEAWGWRSICGPSDPPGNCGNL